MNKYYRILKDEFYLNNLFGRNPLEKAEIGTLWNKVSILNFPIDLNFDDLILDDDLYIELLINKGYIKEE